MIRIIFFCCSIIFTLSTAHAEIPVSRDFLPDSVLKNLRFALDISDRAIYHTESSEVARVRALGFDLHKVISGKEGDIGTLLLQGYVTRKENPPPYSAQASKDSDTEFVYRIFNFNYKLLPRDRLNIRVGHFEIPFGLEQVINTNGTLRDFIHSPNIGVKADWGVSANGSLDKLEYELAVTRGSGNHWSSNGDSYLYAGRIGTYNSHNIAVGLSFLSGATNPDGLLATSIRRERVGIDLQWYVNNFGLLAEYSVGDVEKVDTHSTLIEINTAGINGSWTAYLQWINQVGDVENGAGSTTSAIKLGCKLDFSRHWDVSAEFGRDLRTNLAMTSTNTIAAQVRFRF